MRTRAVTLLLLLAMSPLAAHGQDAAGEEFLAAARKGDMERVRAMLDKGMDVNTKTRYGATALSYASDKGHTALARLLLERGADPNATDTFYGATPMVWAAQKGHTEIVRALIEKGAKHSKDQVLMMGVRGGHKDFVKFMLDQGGILPETLTLALSHATRDKQPEIIELLNKAGAKPGPKADFKVDPETLKSYAGDYKNEQIGNLVFTLKEGNLVGQLTGQGPFTVGAYDKTTFTIIEVVGATIKFNLEGEKVVGFTLKQAGNTFEFKRVEQQK